MSHKKTKYASQPEVWSVHSKINSKFFIILLAIIVIGVFAWNYSNTEISASEAGVETKTLYVSTLGKDTNSGNYSAPLRSISKAISSGAQPGQSLKVIILGPTFTPNSSDDGQTTTIDVNETVAITSEPTGNQVTITPDKSDPRYKYLDFKNNGSLKINNLNFVDANLGVENMGTLDISKNSMRSTKWLNSSAQMYVICVSPKCSVASNSFTLPPVTNEDTQAVGFGGHTSGPTNARLDIRYNTFIYPNISTDWFPGLTYKGIELAREPSAQGSINVASNTFRTEQYGGLKDFAGQVGIYLSGSSAGYSAGINNFSKFSGVNFVYDEVWK